MLMQPTSPNGQFDFMLKNQPQTKKGILPGISKPIKIIVGAIIGLLLLVIVISLFTGGSSVASQPIVSSMARGQEILRVTALTDSQLPLQDPSAKALAATVTATLTSDQSSFSKYLAKNGVKITKLELAADTDKTTEAQLQSAMQNNNLDSAYENYVKENLSKYALSLQTAYKSAGPNGKKILKSAFDSTTIILNSPPLKSQ